MIAKENKPVCPVATTVQLIGSKWKLLNLRNLMARPWRFNELRKDLEGISQKVLTDSLRSMEKDGLIARTVFPEVPPHVSVHGDLGTTISQSKSGRMISSIVLLFIFMTTLFSTLWLIQWTIEALKKELSTCLRITRMLI